MTRHFKSLYTIFISNEFIIMYIIHTNDNMITKLIEITYDYISLTFLSKHEHTEH